MTTMWIKIKMSLPITKENEPENHISNLSDDKEAQIVISKYW